MTPEYQQQMSECVIALRTGKLGTATGKLIEIIDQTLPLLGQNSGVPGSRIQQLINTALLSLERNDLIAWRIFLNSSFHHYSLRRDPLPSISQESNRPTALTSATFITRFNSDPRMINFSTATHGRGNRTQGHLL